MRLLIAVTLLSTVGCAAKGVVRIPSWVEGLPQGAPKLDRLIDLGALPVAAEGLISAAHTDGVFTPGEWIAVVGSELGAQPRVVIGGRRAKVEGYLEGGSLLVRLPRGVPPGIQALTLDNGQGQANLELPIASYVWGADARGDSLRFRRLGPHHFELADQKLDLDFPQARYAALTPEGGVLFAVQEPNDSYAFTPEIVDALIGVVASAVDVPETVEVLVAHLGARGAPAPIARLPVELSSRPTGIAVGPRGVVVVLDRRQLTVLDAADPTRPRVLGRLQLAADGAARELVDAEFLSDGRMLAVLEAYENRVHLVDLSDPKAPRLLGNVVLADAQDEPFSIDMVLSPGGTSVWVLQGPNLRLAGKKLKDGASKLWTSAKVGFKSVPGAPEAPVDSLARVVEVALEPGGLAIKRAVPLPADVFPFFVTADRQGRLFVSALHGQNPFDDLTASPEGVLKLLEGLRDTAQFSRVIQVDPQTAQATTVLQSIAIYYEVAVLPDGRLAASLTRLGPGIIPPRVTLDWGFEIVEGDFVKLREVANTSFKITSAIARLLPPYRYERIGSQ